MGRKRVRKPQTAAGSCQRLATHMPEKLPNVSFGIHKKQVYSFGIHKKQVYNPPTSQETLRLQPATVVCNRYEIISKSGLGKRFRKPQTAAGFVPKACETQARKTLETSPTEPTKRKEKRWPAGRKAFAGVVPRTSRTLALGYRLPKPRTAAGFVPKACKTQARQILETSLTEPTKRKRKKKRWPPARKTFAGLVPRSSRNLAWNTACESLEQQQDSCPRRAKHSSGIAPKSARNCSESFKQKQDSWQMRAKHKPQKLPNVTFGIHKKQLYSPSTSQETVRLPVIAPKSSRNLALENGSERLKQVRSSGIAPTSSRNLALENGSESLEQQQDSCPRHAKHKPEKLSKRRRRNPLKGKKKDSPQALRHRKKHFYYSQVRSSGIAPKSSRNLALENSSESLEQQQDSWPRHAKHKPEKLSKRRRRNPLNTKEKR